MSDRPSSFEFIDAPKIQSTFSTLSGIGGYALKAIVAHELFSLCSLLQILFSLSVFYVNITLLYKIILASCWSVTCTSAWFSLINNLVGILFQQLEVKSVVRRISPLMLTRKHAGVAAISYHHCQMCNRNMK